MTSQNSSTAELLNAVIDTARQAGTQIMQIYQTDFSVDHKDDRSPLTAADLASHHIISDQLALLTPGIPVFSEESAGIPYTTRKTWDRYWLIDPLDGTREFIKKNDEFTVNIALIEGNRPVLGVVFIPVTRVCYFAANGHGAYRQEPDSPAIKIKVRKTTAGKFVVAGSRSHATEKQSAFLAVLGENTEMLAIGSSLKFCLVAEGRVDIYPRFGPTSEWDTAAAHCVVDEAGGIITDTAFNPIEYNTKESVLNPDFLVIADKSFDWKYYLDKCFRENV